MLLTSLNNLFELSAQGSNRYQVFESSCQGLESFDAESADG